MDEWISANALARALRSREVSPTEACDFYFDRIDRLAGKVNPFTEVRADQARDAAQAAEQRIVNEPAEALPPFLGVPMAIKDVVDIAGWPTSHGSSSTSREPRSEDDFVVRRLRDAGFVFVAKTTTSEFASLPFTETAAFGVTRNPWNTDHMSGGSSGGSAAAVAAGLVPLAHGTDGGGSIRVPASCCGVVGLKPSRNRVPNGYDLLEGFDISSVLTRDVHDTAALLDIIGQPDPAGWNNAPAHAPWADIIDDPPRSLRVAVLDTPPLTGEPPAPACHDAVRAVLVALADAGHTVLDEPPVLLGDPDAIIDPLIAILNTFTAGIPIIDEATIQPHNQAMIAQARALDSIAYTELVQRTQTLSREIIDRFETGFDILVTPTMPIEPPLCESLWPSEGEDPLGVLFNSLPLGAHTIMWNAVGLPAISIPVHTSSTGLPIGVQIVAGPQADDLCLRVAAQIEKAIPWRDVHPPPA